MQETKYGENGSVKNAGISKHKWQNIKMELIFQVRVLSLLSLAIVANDSMTLCRWVCPFSVRT
jgi:hypothetical protein